VDRNYGKYVTGFQPLKNGITRTVLLLPCGNAVLQTRCGPGNHLDKGAGNIFQHGIAAKNAQKEIEE